MGKNCTLFCSEYGYCRNRNNGDCAGFAPMNSDEEDFDPMEEKIERTTY